MKINNTVAGFTLAEVLVTLGIIGVISAMTLPTLVKNHQRTVFVTQLHKIYNELSQAGEAMITSKNAIDLFEAGVRSQADVGTFITSQMKTIKSCGSTFTDCFASSYYNINGSVVQNRDGDLSCFVLPSGASICLVYTGKLRFIGRAFVDVLVDVNGKEEPNILGRDLFTMGIFENGSVASDVSLVKPVCMTKDEECLANENRNGLQKCQAASNMLNGGNASYCFAQLLNDGWKMEY